MIYFCYKKYFALTWLGVAGADQCVACRHERRSAPQRGGRGRLRPGGDAPSVVPRRELLYGAYVSPGGQGDAGSWPLCELARWIEENGLPQGCWLNADEAFKGSESCVTPYALRSAQKRRFAAA